MNKYFEQIKRELLTQQHTWLLTGVAGFIGSHLLEFLLKHKQRVVGVDNYSSGFEDNLTQVKDAVGPEAWELFSFVEGDVGDAERISKTCQGVDYVLHQAGLVSPIHSVKAPLLTYESNLMATVRLFHACHTLKVKRVVYASCSSVYGDTQQKSKREHMVGQTSSPFAVTKRMCELSAENFAKVYGLTSVGLRYFNIFGPRQDPDGEYAAVIPRWIVAMIKDEPVTIFGDPDATRDYCHVDNAVQANILAALRPMYDEIHSLFNVGSGLRITLGQLYRTLREMLLPDFPHLKNKKPILGDARWGEPKHVLADTTKIQATLKYDPEVLVNEGLARSVAWYKKNA